MPEVSKLMYLRKAAAIGSMGLIAAAVYELAKSTVFPHITLWQSHFVTIVFLGATSFFLSAMFLRREQARLEASMALSDSLIEHLPGVVCIFDASGRIRRWNANFLGYSAAEIVRAGIMRTVSPESIDTVQQAIGNALANGVAETEAWLVTKSGTKIPCILTGARVMFEDEACVVGVAIDISKRKRAEEQVRLQSAALESAANAIVITDARGAIQWVNPAFTQLTGYLLEEAVGKNPRILKSGKMDDSFYVNLWNTILAGNAWAGEIQNRKKDGRVYTEAMTIAPVRSLSGEITNFVAIKQDVSEPKRVQAALRQSEEQFRELAENLPEMLFVLSLDPVRMTYMSPAYERITGTSRQAVYDDAAAWIKLVLEQDQEYVNMNFAHALRGNRVDLEYRIATADGSVRNIHTRAFPVTNADGKPVRVVGVAADVTEGKRMEAELLKAKDGAETANRAKSQFLANMSHEIRTPMNGIIGMTDLVLETELTPEQSEYLHMVKSSADALLTLLNDILDLSKMEAGKLDLDQMNFDLRKSMVEVAKTLAIRAQEKGLDFIFDVSPEVPANVVGDPARLRQVLVNLIGNAVKFTERGEVEVNVQMDEQSRDGIALHFRVRDTGIGIPVEKHGVIFEPFSQADSSTTRKYGGTGLGLAISTQLVNLMGGKIWVENGIEKGSIFHFSVQVAAGVPPLPTETLDVSQLVGAPILIVDDNLTNRRVLENSVLRWKMEPTVVADAAAALRVLHERKMSNVPLPMLLTDAHMPVMDGFGLVESIRQDPSLADIKIVILTSGGQRGDAARCRELGIAAYLSKPFDRLELREVLLHVLAGRQAALRNKPLVTRHSVRELRQSLAFLVAEDNVVNQKLIARLLEKRGHRVVLAENGREALEKLMEQSFDIVLMDGQMPEMDGFEATLKIRTWEKARGVHVPVIALTAHAMPGDKERCLAAGMDGYVSKPVQPEDLFAVIDEVLANVASRSEMDKVPPGAEIPTSK